MPSLHSLNFIQGLVLGLLIGLNTTTKTPSLRSGGRGLLLEEVAVQQPAGESL